MQHIFYLTILLVSMVQISLSNSLLHISELDSNSLPSVKTEFYFFDDGILPKRNLANEDLKIFANSHTITNFTISNSTISPIANKKVLIYFDLSLDSTFREHSLKIITNLLKFNVPKQIEYHFICFDKLNYDFELNEIDSIKLYDLINNQEFEYISDLEFALNFNQNNPIDYLKKLSGDKEILVFTNSPKSILNDAPILNNFKNANIKFSVYDQSEYGNESFKTLSSKTEGSYLYKKDSVYNNSRILNALLLNYEPTTLDFDLIANCDESTSVTYSMSYYSNTYSFKVSIPDTLKPKIVSDPIDKSFANILPGNSENQEFFIKAINSDVYITDIRLNNNEDNLFQIFGGIDSTNDAPFLLEKDKEYPIQIRFNPIDSALVFAQIVITSDACFGDKINITGGFPNTPPKRKTLKLSYPNCNDTLFANDIINVEWEGVLPRDVVQLEYSLDKGVNWDTLAKNVLNLKHSWQVPDIESDEVMFRVLQLWPNNIGKTLNLNHNLEQLNSAFFSPDGNYIITCSDGIIVRLWNSNSGELEEELYGHSDQVLYAVFSPNGEYAASCGRDGKVIIWHTNPQDPNYGEIYRQFTEHTGWVYSVDFDANSEKVITAGQDGTYKIFNLKTNKLDFSRATGESSIRCVKFAPNNQFYAVGGRQAICRIYDYNSNDLLNEFNTNSVGTNQTIAHLDISPDSKLISLCTRLSKEITIWDIATEKVIKTYTSPPSVTDYNLQETPNSAFFYYNNEDSLLISSSGNSSIRWDLTKTDGKDSTATFLEHTSNVATAFYNFDASRVVTASWDGFAKIWKLKERDIQMDTSDCASVIIKPTLQTDHFSFDYTLLGQSSDSTFSNIITNSTNSTLEIKNIAIRGRDRDDFKLIGNYNNITLNPNESLDVRILFTPSVVGQRLATLEIEIPAKLVNQDFDGMAFDSDVQILTNVIDFKDLEIGEAKELLDHKLLRNISASNLNIDSVQFQNFSFDRFTYLSDNTVNNSLPTGLDLSSNLLFQTDTLGNYKTVLKIYHNDIHQASKFLVFGNGVPPRVDSLTLKIDNIDASVNQTILTPLYISKISSLGVIETITGFKVNLSFNKSILEPLFPYKVIKTTGDIKTIEFDISIDEREKLTETNYTLKNLEFKVALGKEKFSPLTIETVTPIGEGKIVLNWNSANVNISNICSEGGDRLIDTDGVFELSQNYPNPANTQTKIELEIIEKGKTHFYLIDTQGNIIKEYINKEIPAGRYEIELNLKGIPNGVYFYILETENMYDTKKIIINQ